ncbi:MAG: replication-associated recombination protein A [Actinomycetota bacterium]
MADDLFQYSLDRDFDEFAPLAARMRPRNLDEFVGQEHLTGPSGALRALIEGDQVTSLILWGPAGTGKTSLANVIARATKSYFAELSATGASVADVRRVISEAKERLASTGRSTILFVDEIHRFNKSQQDVLLPAVENRWVTLVGATTENPHFEVNSPLLSRSLLFRLERLEPERVAEIVSRALADPERGAASASMGLEPDALQHIVDTSGGDARSALNALEVCVAAASLAGAEQITLAMAEGALQRRQVRYDKKGDMHYHVISAFIKSMRGSDPDAALYWLARMLDAGEDSRFIARRMIIFSSEDVGNADPMALVVATSAFQALEFVGLPEASLNLAQAVIYLATAPKSNASTIALGRANKDAESTGTVAPPTHLRDSAKDYKYPHNFPGAWVEQQYRPEEVNGVYYEPTDRGAEQQIAARLRTFK